MTPVASHPGLFTDQLTRLESGVDVLLLSSRRYLAEAGPAGVDESRRMLATLDCLRVMFPRSLRISSTSCTPSGGFGFLGLIYRSRCRPREDEVKDCRQKGQLRSFGTLAAAFSEPEGGLVAISSCTRYSAGRNNGLGDDALQADPSICDLERPARTTRNGLPELVWYCRIRSRPCCSSYDLLHLVEGEGGRSYWWELQEDPDRSARSKEQAAKQPTKEKGRTKM